MQNRKKQRIIIGTLCAVVVGLALGYAALSQILNINGTSMISGDFSIQFTKIDEDTMVNSKTVTKGGIGTTTTNFTVDLDKPGSSALYDLTVENKGTIDAVLTSIEGLDESNEKEPVDIIYSIEGINEGDTLNAGDSKSFKVRVVWKASATSVPTTSKSLTLKLNYEQNNGPSMIPSTVSIGKMELDNTTGLRGPIGDGTAFGNERAVDLYLNDINGVEEPKDVAYNLTVTSSNPSVLHVKNKTFNGGDDHCRKYEYGEDRGITCHELVELELVGPGSATITVTDVSNGNKISETYTVTEDDIQVMTGDFKLRNIIKTPEENVNSIYFEIPSDKTSSDYQFVATSSDPSICEIAEVNLDEESINLNIHKEGDVIITLTDEKTNTYASFKYHIDSYYLNH